MYEFAIVALLGVGTLKLVDLIAEHVDVSRLHTLVSWVLGVVVAWVLGFSLFAEWGLEVRSEALGFAATGLMIAAAGYTLPAVIERAGDFVGRRHSAPTVSKAA